jgi:hypothetical protein
MDAVQSNDAGSSLVSITVFSVTPMRAGKLFALASTSTAYGSRCVVVGRPAEPQGGP